MASGQTSGVPANSSPLMLPSAIAYDAAGNLYVSEAQRHTVRKIDTQGRIFAFAGDGTQGFAGDGLPALNAELNTPQGVAIDAAGNVFIADSGNNRIRRVDVSTGSISTVAGSGVGGFRGDGGPATSASLDMPRAICLDPSGGKLHIADTRNHRIRSVDFHTGLITTLAGNGTQGLAGDDGFAIDANLDSPSSLAADASGDLFIADTHNQRIRRVSAVTSIIRTVIGPGVAGGTSGGTPATSTFLVLPRGLTFDSGGNLLIADSGNHRILQMNRATGAVTGVAGGTTQAFSGDGGAAVAAGLDSPQAVALSPGGLVSIADSGNQRIRQLVSQPAPSTALETIAGLGAASSTSLSIVAPAVAAYGSGSVAVSLGMSTPASGAVTLIDVSEGSGIVIGTGALVSNAATISLTALSAGQHRILATYAGDTTHAAAQTATTSVLIAPLPLKATPSPATMIFGTQPPTLGGTIEGVLPQDASRVNLTFSTSANASSPAGAYPISAVLSGDAAANYNLQTATVTLVITQAASTVLLRNESADGSFTGTLSAQVSSSTSGVPSGLVSLLDNGTTVQQAAMSAGGIASFTHVTLSAGSHMLAAAYAGDRNFLPASSTSLPEIISAPTPGDFTLTAGGPGAQLLLPGSSVTYTFAIQMTNSGLSSPVNLSVSGLPAFTKASFNPSYVPPSASGTTGVVLTVSSPASTSAQASFSSGLAACVTMALSLPFIGMSIRRARFDCRKLSLLSALALLGVFGVLTLSGCGDRINTSGQSSSATQSYTLTVTGTGTGSEGTTVQHSATVVLTQNTAQ